MHRPAGLLLPFFGGWMCFPFRNPPCNCVSRLYSFIQLQIVAEGTGSVPAPRLKCSRACLCSETRLALLLSILSRSLGSLQSNFTTQLLAGICLSLFSLPDSLGGSFLSPFSKKAKWDLSPCCPGSPTIGGAEWRLSVCWELHIAAAARASLNAAETGAPSLLHWSPGSLCCASCIEPLCEKAPQPWSPRDVLLPGVVITTSPTPHQQGHSFLPKKCMVLDATPHTRCSLHPRGQHW